MDKLDEIKNELDNNQRHQCENLLSVYSIDWLIDEVEAMRTKRNQCEDTISSLLAECKRQNREIERLRKIEDAAIAWNDSINHLEASQNGRELALTIADNPRPDDGGE